MRTAWGLLAVVVLVGCGTKKERDKSPIVHEEDIAPLQAPPPVAVTDEPAVAPTIDPLPPPPKAECLDESTVVSWDPAKLRACFDSNDDDQADRCVTWRRDGKVASIDSEFAVEEVDAKAPAEPPVEFHESDGDERITVDGTTVEICPFDRACLKIMPKLGDAGIEKVLTDADYKRAAFVIRDYEETRGLIEIWDLAAGRLRTRTAIKRLVPDETYAFSAHLGAGVVIGLADDSNGRALGTVIGLDGGVRGDLAHGSRNLDVERTFQTAGVFGIVDLGPIDAEDKPYVVHLTSLATGGALGKLTIARDDDGDDDLSLHPLNNGFVGVTQFGEQVRIDMIDLRTRTNRVLLAPGC